MEVTDVRHFNLDARDIRTAIIELIRHRHGTVISAIDIVLEAVADTDGNVDNFTASIEVKIKSQSEIIPRPDSSASKVPGKQKGGRARAASLTAERRSEIAKQAADRRWSKSVNG